jgi:hypothetical protein
LSCAAGKDLERATDERELLGDLKGIAAPEFTAEWVKGAPEDWATQSLQIAKKAYYLPETQTVISLVQRLVTAITA